MNENPDNVRSIVSGILQKNAEQTIALVMTDEFINFIVDDGEKRYESIEEQRAFVFGAAVAVGYFGHEIKRGIT